MARQSEYLASLLKTEADAEGQQAAPRRQGSTLLSRESALARVNSGEVRQVTQLLLDPARVKVWPGNARLQSALDEASCRDLIDSIIAEGGQRVPVVVRRLEGDPTFEYEVIAGTRRHFSISWLRANAYPDMQLLAQVQNLDDEAAFRLADLENRARKDVSDLERARNYAAALASHYDGHLTRMAERLRLSKGWLSKMLRVAKLPDDVLAAFGSLFDIQLKPAYALALALDDSNRTASIKLAAESLAEEQNQRRANGLPSIVAADVYRQLLATAPDVKHRQSQLEFRSRLDRPLLSLQSSNRQGATVRLHAGSGASDTEILDAMRELLDKLRGQGRGGVF